MSTDQASRARRDTILDALGDGTRRAIIDLLAERPRAVGELADVLPVTRPAVSIHLRVLRDAGLVQSEADGTRRIYQLDPEGLVLLRTYLDLMWGGALHDFARAAEAAHAADRGDQQDPNRPPSRTGDPDD